MSQSQDHGSSSQPVASKGPWEEAWGRIKKSKMSLVYLAIVGAYLLLSLVTQATELFAGDEPLAERPYEVSVELLQGEEFAEKLPPSFKNSPDRLLGTDHFGRSVFWRVVHGTRVSVIVGLVGAVIACCIGVVLGALAGFFGGWVDDVVVYVYSTLSSIPYLLLMLSLAFVFKNGGFADWYQGSFLAKFFSLGVFNLVFVIGITFWVTLCRLIRATVLQHRELEYVAAASALGAGRLRVLFRHVLPNVFHLVIVNFSLTFVVAVKSEVILSFLGLGVDQEPSWGQIIARGKLELMQGIWWPSFYAGLAMFILVLAVNSFGDRLRDALDPRLKH